MPVKYTKDILEPLVKESKTWKQVCEKLGVTPATGAQSHITKISRKFGIDDSHFSGTSWNRGRTFPKKFPLEDYLNNTRFIKSNDLKLRLIKEGLKKWQCEICKRTKWNDAQLPIELDHIDSNHFNNQLSNLQIVCPNCHAIVTKQRKAREIGRASCRERV